MGTAVEYIIVGQGLAGSALAWELVMRGKSVAVYDEPLMNRASTISAGICNPITGKGMVKSYKADELFPFLARFYGNAERKLSHKFFYPLPVYRPFISNEEMRQWKDKVASGVLRNFISKVCDKPAFSEEINDPHGGLQILQSGYLNVPDWISSIRNMLVQMNCYHQEHFSEEELIVEDTIRYRGYTASKIIFCNGLGLTQSAWFDWLPLRPLKGETLTVRVDIAADQIISRGVYLVPSGQDSTFIVGSTYQHAPFTHGPTEQGRSQLETRLRSLIRPAFTTIHQDWGIRPTVTDRRPLMGSHPANNNVIIFNGLGTKGVSLAPYFARCLADWMDQGVALPEEVNIFRFKSLYSR